MDLEMKYVYAVYQENSFSQAAKKLFISQSAVSAVVRKAEQEIGCQIFDRSTIPFTLTPEGRFYIESIEKIQKVERDMQAYFDDRKNLKVGHLSVGSSSFYSAYFLARMVKAFQKSYPGIHIEIKEGDGKELTDSLSDGTLDFLFGTLTQGEKETRSLLYGYEHLILAVPENVEANRRLINYQIPAEAIRSGAFLEDRFPPVPLWELRDCRFISLTKTGSDLYQRTLDICRNAGFTPQVTQYLSQIMTAYYVAAAGGGAAFIRSSLFSMIQEQKGLVYYKVDDPLTKRAICLTYRKDRYISHAMSAFLTFAAELPASYRR